MKSSLPDLRDLIAIQVTPSSFAASASASKTIFSVADRSLMRQTALINEMLIRKRYRLWSQSKRCISVTSRQAPYSRWQRAGIDATARSVSLPAHS